NFNRLRVRARPSPARGGRLPAFRDGLAAQKWFEWRLFGWFLPVLMLVFGALMVLIVVLDQRGNVPSTNELSMIGVMFLMFGPMTGGSYAAQSLNAPWVAAGPSRAAVPLSDFELARAKLSLAIRSHLLGLTIMLAIMTIVLAMSHSNAAAARL